MSTPFLSEIRIMSFNFPPRGWAFCNGQIMPISQNQALFSLLGTTFGGDGRTTYGLPNLQGRVPTGVGAGLTLGAPGGQEQHTLAASEIPGHNHSLSAKATPASISAAGPTPSRSLAEGIASTSGGTTPVSLYGTGSVSVPFAGDSIGPNAGGQAHENRQPSLALSFCIALQGIFPSRN